MLGRTLLIIDDDRAWRNLTAKYFAFAQYDAHTADTCAEGIRLAEALRPDYILLDYHLEDGNAVTVSSHIRSSENLKKTLILIVSGDETRRESAYAECQADHFILKCTPYKTIDDIMRGLKRRVHWDCGIVEKGDIRLQAGGHQVFRGHDLIAELSPEHFRFLSVLLERAPEFVSEEELCRTVLKSEFTGMKHDALKMTAYRLRRKLGTQIGRRIRSEKDSGWIYVQPRLRAAAPEENGPKAAAA